MENKKDVLSSLWIVLMLNMIFNDIYGISIVLDTFAPAKIPSDAQTMMLIAAFITNIPLMMILFSKVLKYKINRILNICVAVFTIIYVWGGMSSYPHYIAVASIETLLAIVIIIVAWKWKKEE